MNVKNVFFNNLSLKVFSLFLAIGVWVMITGQARSSIEKFINIDVEFVNVLKNVNIDSNPDKVRIKVKGISNEIKLLTENDFTVKIDLSNVRDGIRNYYTRDFLKTEKSNFINSVHPAMIEVNVREIHRKIVPVKVRFAKVLNNKKYIYRQERIGEIGYTYIVKPEKVTIEGYKNDIVNINSISLESEVPLSDSDESVTKKFSLKKPKEILRIIENNEIEVTVNVKNKVTEKDSKEEKNEKERGTKKK